MKGESTSKEFIAIRDAGGEVKIGIVGYGVIGKAQEYLAKELGHEVFVIDKIDEDDMEKNPYSDKNLGLFAEWTKICDCNIIFFCVPESEIENAIVLYKDNTSESNLLVIKSTVPIGATQKLMEKYNIHICHNPEFLREASWKEDVLRPSLIVIGQCCNKHGALLKSFYKPLNIDIERVITDPTTSETIKLTLNAYLSTQLMFWKSIKQLCDKYAVDVYVVADVLRNEPRVSHYGNMPITNKLGGRCLPKDLDQIIRDYAIWTDIEPVLFNAVKQVSEK